MRYATDIGKKPPSVRQCFVKTWEHAKTQQKKQRFGLTRYLFTRLQIGPGTVRVGVGMAIGQQIFDYVKETLESNTNPAP